MSVILTTALFELPGRPLEEYVRLLKELLQANVPIILFLEKRLGRLIPEFALAEDIIYFERPILENRQLPKVRNESKDTLDYLTMMNAKTAFLAELIFQRESTHYGWIDAGILKIVPEPKRLEFLTKLSSLRPNRRGLFMPGCWAPVQEEYRQTLFDFINWRFCGGFFLGDGDSVDNFVRVDRKTQYERITWEVNKWALLELDGLVKFDWYKSDHNETIIDIPKEMLL